MNALWIGKREGGLRADGEGELGLNKWPRRSRQKAKDIDYHQSSNKKQSCMA